MEKVETTKRRFLATATGIVGGAIVATHTIAFADTGCSPSNISVKHFQVQDDNDVATYVIGSVINKCDVDARVQLKVIFYNKSNDILQLQEFWLDDSVTIPRHSEFSFELPFSKVFGFDHAEVSVRQVITF